MINWFLYNLNIFLFIWSTFTKKYVKTGAFIENVGMLTIQVLDRP